MDITALLRRVQGGDRGSLDEAIALVYQELKKLAAGHVQREGPRTPMQATTLVHEAYLRLVRAKHPDYQNRAHFYAIASRVMRHVLVDAARSRLTSKRDGGIQISLSINGLEQFGVAVQSDRTVLNMDEAIERLGKISDTKAELIEMRYFGGMTAEECAEAKSMSVHMVRKELRLAQAWLRAELSGSSGQSPA